MSDHCVEDNQASETGQKRDDADALFILGIRYSTGRDVQQDFVAAHKWFNLAAMMGHAGALSTRAELAGEMTTEQIAEAQRQARAWLWTRNAPKPDENEGTAVNVKPIYVRRRVQQLRSAKSFSRITAA